MDPEQDVDSDRPRDAEDPGAKDDKVEASATQEMEPGTISMSVELPETAPPNPRPEEAAPKTTDPPHHEEAAPVTSDPPHHEEAAPVTTAPPHHEEAAPVTAAPPHHEEAAPVLPKEPTMHELEEQLRIAELKLEAKRLQLASICNIVICSILPFRFMHA